MKNVLKTAHIIGNGISRKSFDLMSLKDKGKVFSCFACGGGSTMGYKLAGFDVIGCNEIDPKMIEAYKTNHNPKYSYLEPIQTFKLRKDLPKELYNLDILDGSPPCSSFRESPPVLTRRIFCIHLYLSQLQYIFVHSLFLFSRIIKQ